MRVAILSTVCWRTPPRHYGPWEMIASLVAEGLVKRGVDGTLFATGDSQTNAKLEVIYQKYRRYLNNPPIINQHITSLFLFYSTLKNI